ncbi:SMP-30/gluconolactonase/LRE family protein [Spirilliplanes yamanashiensis]|uniref:Calcium-binding protein n=1 Tax=Spirilliplanes yamanashiensis TaxID=42233 RepID=A0A8J3Y6Z8_9ACTN|nr:SMP-30/gluconolactonase/LRE family protein [Spirilliplanes yamanashiensis]MDP9817313.1 sugar lactone lactonase YvrE [Spirilliplanes yamanashiensis]GIJ03036.1 calcium-binding protein [Spirilliplanes yamanashiensis]
MTNLTALGADRLELGEGGRWDGERVVLVDIPAGRLLTTATPLRPGAGALTELARLPEPLAAVAPVADRPGTWLAATGTGFALLGPDGRATPVASPEPVTAKPWRMNDAVADRAGRFWAGSMACDQSPRGGALYRLDPDGTVRTVLRGLTIGNGPAFSLDGRTMYLSDTPLGHVDAFDVDPATGELSGRRPFLRLAAAEGHPDGLTVDAEDHLWVALFGAGEVRRVRPDGTVDRRVTVPARQPTSVCLAGTMLMVTSGRGGLDDPGDADGAVLVGDAGVAGVPVLPVRVALGEARRP